jgi:hypothetical protein
MHGPPGTGKSAAIATLEAIMVQRGHGGLLKTAWTGVAAALLATPLGIGWTLCKIFGINPLGKKKKKGAEDTTPGGTVAAMSDKAVELFLRNAPKDLRVLVIDEVSVVTPIILATIDARLRHLLKNPDVPFGGCAVILCGDFWQLPPPGAKSLYQLLVATVGGGGGGGGKRGGSQKKKAPAVRGGKKTTVAAATGDAAVGTFPEGAAGAGLRLFREFRRFELTQPMRSRGCKARFPGQPAAARTGLGEQ